jgi:uncharacterized membrane protein (UPF0127 family)
VKLLNASKNLTVIENVAEASTTLSRMIGLLGRSSLGTNEALWIDRCPTIHTFFMKFAIDVVFVDNKLSVKACYHNVKAWRLILPVWGARSVFEMPVGAISRGQIEVGDQLNVVH